MGVTPCYGGETRQVVDKAIDSSTGAIISAHFEHQPRTAIQPTLPPVAKRVCNDFVRRIAHSLSPASFPRISQNSSLHVNEPN